MSSLSRTSNAPCIRSRSDSEPTRMPTTVSDMSDVATKLPAGEIYARGGFIRGGPSVGGGRSERRHVQDAAAVRHEPTVVKRGTRVKDECTGCLRGCDPLDRRPGVALRGVVAARQHNRDGSALGGVERDA